MPVRESVTGGRLLEFERQLYITFTPASPTASVSQFEEHCDTIQKDSFAKATISSSRNMLWQVNWSSLGSGPGRELGDGVPSQAGDLCVDEDPQQSPYTSQSASHLHRPPSIPMSYVWHSVSQERQVGSDGVGTVTLSGSRGSRDGVVAADENRIKGEFVSTNSLKRR